MKTFRTTGVFGLLVIAFASYIYYFEVVKKSEEEKKEEEAKLVFQLEKSEVSRISLAPNGKDEIEIKKVDGKWQITKPLSDLAADSAISSLVSTMTSAKGEFVVEGEDVNLKEFGLDNPKGVMSIEDKGGKVHSYSIGTVTSFDGDFYALPKGEKKVLLVKAFFANQVDKKLLDLRDKSLLREKLGELSMISVTDRVGKGEFTLAKESGKWHLKDQPGIKINQSSVKKWIEKFESLQANEYLSEDQDPNSLKKHKLNKPRYQATFTGKGSSKEVKISLSEIKDSFFAIMSTQRQVILQARESNFKDLALSRQKFYDKKHPFELDTSPVKRIRLTTNELGDQKLNLELSKNGEVWVMGTEVEGKTLDSAKVDNLLSQIKTFEAVSFLGDKTNPAAKRTDVGQFVLASEDGTQLFELKWGEEFEEKNIDGEDAKQFPVRTSKSELLLGVSTASIEGLALDKLLIEKKVEKVAKNDSEKTDSGSSAATNSEIETKNGGKESDL